MASTLKVQNIQHTNNTTALNIDTNGRILTPARPSFMARGHLGGTGAVDRQRQVTHHQCRAHYQRRGRCDCRIRLAMADRPWDVLRC